jgi:hypothetical protein
MYDRNSFEIEFHNMQGALFEAACTLSVSYNLESLADYTYQILSFHVSAATFNIK